MPTGTRNQYQFLVPAGWYQKPVNVSWALHSDSKSSTYKTYVTVYSCRTKRLGTNHWVTEVLTACGKYRKLTKTTENNLETV